MSYAQLMNCDMLLLICGGIHDYVMKLLFFNEFEQKWVDYDFGVNLII